MTDGVLTLTQIESQLRTLRIRPLSRVALQPARRGRPGTKRRALVDRIVELATADLGHTWDRPVHWRPIREVLAREGYPIETIRRAIRNAGIELWPRRKCNPDARMAYPPGLELPPDPAPDSRRAEQSAVSIEQAQAVERGVDALGDALGLPGEEVATIVQDAAKLVEQVYLPERLEVRIGLVQGLRHSTRETLAGHKVRTVSDAIDLGDWLDKLVSADQACRLRKFARGE